MVLLGAGQQIGNESLGDNVVTGIIQPRLFSIRQRRPARRISPAHTNSDFLQRTVRTCLPIQGIFVNILRTNRRKISNIICKGAFEQLFVEFGAVSDLEWLLNLKGT